MLPDIEQNPLATLHDWLEEARQADGVTEPDAMTLATVDEAGFPDARVVLVKDVSPQGVVFYTNLRSRKAEQLQHHPWAALCLHWAPLGRQVRLMGHVEAVSAEEADAYFASRPRLSRIGAWASKQSQPMQHVGELECRVATYSARYAIGPVPRPPFWSGYRVCPLRIEFWRKKPYRLHERLQLTRESPDAPWQRTSLFP